MGRRVRSVERPWFVGLPDTGVFGNISWLDSKIVDEFGERRFNGQSKYVYNFGMIQDIPSVGAAFGATYRKQGGAFDRTVGEEVFTSYGADSEVFVEKRFGKSLRSARWGRTCSTVRSASASTNLRRPVTRSPAISTNMNSKAKRRVPSSS